MLDFDIATISDAQSICDLLNLSYRQNLGWTNEYAIVAGPRCDKKHIEKQIQMSNVTFLVIRNKNDLQSCISITMTQHDAEFGAFAVHPQQQNKGHGSQLLLCAEYYAQKKLGANKAKIFVLKPRTELIEYYHRRGFNLSNNTKYFPQHLNVGQPLIENLQLIEMIKTYH